MITTRPKKFDDIFLGDYERDIGGGLIGMRSNDANKYHDFSYVYELLSPIIPDNLRFQNLICFKKRTDMPYKMRIFLDTIIYDLSETKAIITGEVENKIRCNYAIKEFNGIIYCIKSRSAFYDKELYIFENDLSEEFLKALFPEEQKGE